MRRQTRPLLDVDRYRRTQPDDRLAAAARWTPKAQPPPGALATSRADLRARNQRTLARRSVRDDPRPERFANLVRRVSQGSDQDIPRLRGISSNHRPRTDRDTDRTAGRT